MKKKHVLFASIAILISCNDADAANSFSKTDATNSPSKKYVVNSPLKTIEISKASYDTYPAVWFSPSTGEITPTNDGGDHPGEKYLYWIEPRDPEFEIPKKFDFKFRRNDDKYGIKYIGDGQALFNSTNEYNQDWETLLYETDIFQTDKSPDRKRDVMEKMAKDNRVFYFSNPEGNCIIMITKYYGVYPDGRTDGPTREYNLEFKWKKIK